MTDTEQLKTNSNYVPHFLEKFAFGMGDFWTSIAYNAMATYLTMFYTDIVGISAGTAAMILLSVRFIIAVWDLIVGVLVDRTKSKEGKARPWVLKAGILFGISFILLFTNPFAGSNSPMAVVYAFGIYFVVNFFYSAVNIPYGSLNSLITSNINQRTTLNVYRMLIANVGSVLLSLIAMPFINLFPAKSPMGWGLLFGFIGVLIPFGYYFTYKFTKERVTPVAENDDTPKEVISLKRQFGSLFKNKYWWITTILGLANWIYQGIANGMNAYIAKYVLNDSNLMSILGVATVLPVVIGLPFSGAIIQKVGKRNAAIGGLVIIILASLVILINPYSETVIVTSILLRAVGLVPVSAASNPMLTDVIDFGEWKYGFRSDGLVFSANSFGMKIGMGLSSAMVAWVLALSHYNGQLAHQSGYTLTSILNAFTWVPVAVSVFMIILMIFYDLDKKNKQISQDLAARGEGQGN